jgi:hypothetical protein
LLHYLAFVSIAAAQDEDAYFNFPDMSSLTVFADNVVPCMLRHFGTLTVSDELAAAIAAGRAIGAADEIALRAAAVVVGDRIVAALRARGVETATAASVDYYLWTEAKVGELRALPRHANPLTYFY